MTTIPNLIHKVPIEILPWSPSDTFYDPDTNEPISRPTYGTKVEITGQPKWFNKDKVQFTVNGVDLTTIGYIMFRYIDLNAKGWTPKRQDKIIRIGHLTNVNWYVAYEEPCAHYSYGPSMVKVYFTDLNPGKV